MSDTTSVHDDDLPISDAFGILPNSVARDPKVSPELLVLISYRLTFAGDYGLNERQICNRRDGAGTDNPIVCRGLSRDVFRRAIDLGDRLGLMKRWQPPGNTGQFKFAQDRLTLPPCGASGFAGRRVYRGWFDGKLDVKELAALLFLRAGTGKGAGIYVRELEARFGWSRPTALRVMHTLDQRCLIETHKDRDQRGRFKSTTYVPGPMPGAATVKNTGDGFHRRREKPAANIESPSHEPLSSGESLPRRESPSTEKRYAPPALPAAA